MKKFSAVIITVLLGVLLHFLYDWSDKNAFVALFSAVNESTWEHLKLLFFPFLLISIAEYFIYKPDFKKFFSARCIGMLCGLLSIIVIFYTYTGIYKNVDWVNIAIFVVSVILSFFVSYKMYKKAEVVIPSALSIGIFLTLAILFFIFTFYPPDINLFIDPTVQ